MAYKICYGQNKNKRKPTRIIWTCFFFLLFLALANIFFNEQLAQLREIVFSDTTQAFLQDLLEGVGADAH